MKGGVFIFLLLLSAAFVQAQMTDRIETDRPDQTESPFVVPKRYFQGEFGLTIANYEGDLKQLAHPTALLKYGWTNRVEFRLEATPYSEYFRLVPNSKKEFKLEPVEVGAKVRLFEEAGLRPKISIIAHAGLPFLSTSEFHHTGLTYITRLTMQHSLSDNTGLGYNIGVQRDVAGITSAFYTFAPGFNIGERWYAYVETFGSFGGGENDHNLDAGIAYNPTPNTKIDLSGGFGLGSAPLQNYMALGFSFRLPLRKR